MSAPVKRGRGRPKLGARPRPNPRRGGRYDIVDFNDKPIETQVFTKHEAEAILDELKFARRMKTHPARTDVLLSDVIAECGSAAPPSAVKHLIRHLGEVPLYELTRDVCFVFADLMREGRRLKKEPKASSIDNVLGHLRGIINTYCDEHTIPRPTVHLVGGHKPPRDFLRVSEVERLIRCAEEGLVWDRDAGDWRRLPDGSLVRQDAKWLSTVSAMPRLITLCLWTGSRVDVMKRLRWTKNAEEPWFDPRISVIHRRGSAERRTRKGRPDVKLKNALVRLMRAWERADAKAGIDRVIHDDKGGPCASNAWVAFALVREAAGLPESVTFRTLRASCAVYLMENGCTPEEAADYLGNTAAILTAFYDRYAPEFSHAAVDALDSRTYHCSEAFKKRVTGKETASRATNIGAGTPKSSTRKSRKYPADRENG